MKSLTKDESGVAYLLLVGFIFTIIVVGVAFMFISDFVDAVVNGINGYQGTNLANQMDDDSISTGNLLFLAFKLCLIPALIVLAYWVWNMGQKPVRPY